MDIFQKICEVRAPGKAILSGQHAVVYGEDAIAMAIGLHCSGTLSVRKKLDQKMKMYVQLDIESQGFQISVQLLQKIEKNFENKAILGGYSHFLSNLSEKQKSFSEHYKSLHYKIGIFAYKMKISWQKYWIENPYDILIEINSNIPLGKCLGSSAAFNTVFATILLTLLKRNAMKQLNEEMKNAINDISVVFESVEHGTPSGIDNFVSVYGGIILFNKEREPKFKFLDQMTEKFKEMFEVAIADSKVQKNTKAAVEMVRQKCSQNEENVKRIKEIGRISESILTFFEKEGSNCEEFFTLLKKNHRLLKELNLSHPEIQKLIDQGAKHGWTGKITGSGMGGCILLLSKAKQYSLSQEFQIAHLDQQGLMIKFLNYF